MSSTGPKASIGKDIDKSPSVVGRMFDLITPTYDRLNRLMSFSADRGWRRAALEQLDASDSDLVLDVATGTGDMALEATRTYGCPIIGIDLSRNMLRTAVLRWAEESGDDRYSVVQGDALAMPFGDQAFDRAMCAFGIRNMTSLGAFLDETRRCLRTGGLLVVVELSLPANPVLRPLLLFYLTKVLPLVARVEGGDPIAYRYLSESIIRFPPPEQVERTIVSRGFDLVSSRPLTFGSCHLYVLEKRA
jgi:demethylmenaquinone methyltransferase/2-methoxy-6-polyprenyl-1,4-benzoquinol methylase